MSWENKKAVNRIFNTFKRLKDKIYEEDIDALKLLNELVEQNKRAVANDNILYAKLLCFFINRNALHFGSIQLAIKEAHNELLKPLPVHIKELQIALNRMEEMRQGEKIKTGLDLLNVKQEKWTLGKVEDSFYNSANTFIKDVNNYS